MKTIKIGTRDSQLALWQAHFVEDKLKALGIPTEIVPLKSKGDIVLDKPLYELGITGVFTKTLDLALLNGDIDIAVHSLKDVPTIYPKGIAPLCYMERAAFEDLLVYKPSFKENTNKTIATSSLRRKAFLTHLDDSLQLMDIRGNIQTRLQKLLDTQEMDATIFAKAGIDRSQMWEEIEKQGLQTEILSDMLPAPAQGTVVVTYLTAHSELKEVGDKLNHLDSEMEVTLERDFLNAIEGGCTTPVGAKSTVLADQINFKATVLTIDGKESFSIEKIIAKKEYKTAGKEIAEEFLESGGKTVVDKVKAYFNEQKN